MELEKKVSESTVELRDMVRRLKQSNHQLENEVKKKITAQKEVRKALIIERELGQLKNKFLSMASHEFRAPLSGILTSAVLIEKYNASKYNQEGISKHTEIIKSMVKHLSNILDDFLSLDKLEKGEVNYIFTEFRFNELMEQTIEEAKSLLKKGQSINYIPCKYCFKMFQDKKIVHIIITNILCNAIKYSPENSVINVKIIENDDLLISIKDNGIGIPKEDQSRIFNRFYRASNTNHIQGTGVGLNLVKTNIEGIGGKISFNSVENSGTTFVIKIPKRVKL